MNQIAINVPCQTKLTTASNGKSATETYGLAQVKAEVKASGLTGKALKTEVDRRIRAFSAGAAGTHAAIIADGGYVKKVAVKKFSDGAFEVTTVVRREAMSREEVLARNIARMRLLIAKERDEDGLNAEETAELDALIKATE